MIVIGSNTSDNGQSHFTEDVLHFMEFRQNRQLALLKSAKSEFGNPLFVTAHFEVLRTSCVLKMHIAIIFSFRTKPNELKSTRTYFFHCMRCA